MITPYVTEKSYSLASGENPVFTFLVSRNCRLPEIKSFIEQQYKKEVVEVRFVNNPGKTVTRRQVKGRTSSRRKALVGLKKGQRIADFNLEDNKSSKQDGVKK